MPSDGPVADLAEKPVPRKASGLLPPPEKLEDGAPAGVADFPGPATHAPTDCGDAAVHFEKVLGDDVIPAPLGKVYTLLFGPGSATWMGRWLTVDQKCTELQMEDKRGLTDEIRTRNYTYIKPLYASIGPKQTKCIVTEQLEQIDLEKAVSILVSTQNPDVPSGNIFVVKTRYCLTWAENNGTRIQVNNVIEWSGKSWLKGMYPPSFRSNCPFTDIPRCHRTRRKRRPNPVLQRSLRGPQSRRLGPRALRHAQRRGRPG